MTASSLAITVKKVSADCVNSVDLPLVDDQVAVEEPLEIRLGYNTDNGRTATSISITMRTPGCDAELAVGFLYSEAIVTRAEDIQIVEHCGPAAPDTGNHNIVRVDLASHVAVDLGRLQRHFYTTSSCGVCGKSSLEALRTTGAVRLDSVAAKFGKDVLIQMPAALRARQQTFDQTGGLHAAAAFDSQGEILVVHEDVGRHNAVDKVIGTLLMRGLLPASNLGLIVSGRASFELMQKTLVAGIPLLAAVSAPSSLAVQLAREFNVSLVGFLRGDTFNIYSAGERIT
ncbi:MAG: formate dehydrogenase accessory sulfurtransferase FdhD [Woeseiaceae bacterium]|nr:formate dehydrogenase accessory sulfurtransferase FdhD [Woeseiaceae bacterium]